MSFFDSLRQSANEMATEAQKMVHIQRLQITVSNLHRERDQATLSVGRKAVEKLRSGSLQDEELGGLAQQVFDLDARIASTEEQIRRLKVESAEAQGSPQSEPGEPAAEPGPQQDAEPSARFCPNCGARARDEAIFCTSCGTRL